MSRGTDDFTVQQLMNFIGEQLATIDSRFDQMHRNLGYSFMSNGPGDFITKSRSEEITNANTKRNILQELQYEIERKCGELYDSQNAGAEVE
jgi:hypothetical protein